jgi:hypothetical protein
LKRLYLHLKELLGDGIPPIQLVFQGNDLGLHRLEFLLRVPAVVRLHGGELCVE